MATSPGLIVLGSAEDLAKHYTAEEQTRLQDSGVYVMNLSAAGRIIGFIQKWDPDQHPRGWHGLFIDTPDADKTTVKEAQAGDIIATSRGTIKVVAADNTSQVHAVNRDTGEVLPKVTSMSPWQPVARLGNIYTQKHTDPEQYTGIEAMSEAGNGHLAPPDPRNRLALMLSKWEHNHHLENPDEPPKYPDGKYVRNMEEHLEHIPDLYTSELKAEKYVLDVTGDNFTLDSNHSNAYVIQRLQKEYQDEYISQIKKAKANFDAHPNRNPVDAARFAVAEWLYDPQKGDQPGRVPEWMEVSQSAEDEVGVSAALRTFAFRSDAVKVATDAYREAQLPPVPPLPPDRLEEAKRFGVTRFMQSQPPGYAGEGSGKNWSGGPLDFENLLSEDPEVREGWFMNYFAPPPLGEVQAQDQWLVNKMRDLQVSVDDSVAQAEQAWARSYRRYGAGSPADHTVEVLGAKDLHDRLQKMMDGTITDTPFHRLDPTQDERWEGQNSVSRQIVMDLAMRRWDQQQLDDSAQPGNFDMPKFDEMRFEPQDMKEVEDLLKGTESEYIDVPVFFQTGKLDDGVLMVGVDHQSRPYANGNIDTKFDADMQRIMEEAGAKKTPNSQDLTEVFPYSGSGELYRGDSLTIEDGGDPTEIHPKDRWFEVEALFAKDIHSALKQADKEGGQGEKDVESAQRHGANVLDEWKYKAGEVAREAEPVESLDQINEKMLKELGGVADDWGVEIDKGAYRRMVQTGKGPALRTIEYVPHNQTGDSNPDADGLTTGAATSQRGQLRLRGYTPQEAADKLKELGIAGDLEPEVPFNVIMGGRRRFGKVTPLHSMYLRGEATPPEMKGLITHGVTGGHEDLMKILDTGALLPISERTRLGITTASSTSEKGDVRSGLDEAIFGTIGYSNWGGSNAGGIVVGFKPRVYLRRDVIVSPTDYGGSPTRYSDYTAYKGRIRDEAGLHEKTSLFDPLEPQARDIHVRDNAPGEDSNEWNAVGGVPVEDWAFIRVGSRAQQTEVEHKLDILQKRGLVATKPPVILNKQRVQKATELELPLDKLKSDMRQGADAKHTLAVTQDFPQAGVVEDDEKNVYWTEPGKPWEYKLSTESDGRHYVSSGIADMESEETRWVLRTDLFDNPEGAITAAAFKEMRPINPAILMVDDEGVEHNASSLIYKHFSAYPSKGSDLWIWAAKGSKGDFAFTFGKDPKNEKLWMGQIIGYNGTEDGRAFRSVDPNEVLEWMRDDSIGKPPPGNWGNWSWKGLAVAVESHFYDAKVRFNWDENKPEWTDAEGNTWQLGLGDLNKDEDYEAYKNGKKVAAATSSGDLFGQIAEPMYGDYLKAEVPKAIANATGMNAKDIQLHPAEKGEGGKPERWTWSKYGEDFWAFYDSHGHIWRVESEDTGWNSAPSLTVAIHDAHKKSPVNKVEATKIAIAAHAGVTSPIHYEDETYRWTTGTKEWYLWNEGGKWLLDDGSGNEIKSGVNVLSLLQSINPNKQTIDNQTTDTQKINQIAATVEQITGSSVEHVSGIGPGYMTWYKSGEQFLLKWSDESGRRFGKSRPGITRSSSRPASRLLSSTRRSTVAPRLMAELNY